MGDVCSVDGCDRPTFARGLCERHYMYLRRTGRVSRRMVRKVCPACGQWFTPDRADQIFDGEPCRLRWWRRRQKDPTLKPRPDTHAYVFKPSLDDRKHSRVRIIPFTPSQLWEKTRGICAICHRPIDRDAAAGTAGSAVSVWILPPSLLGVASLDDRTLVHLKCWERRKRHGNCLFQTRKQASERRGIE